MARLVASRHARARAVVPLRAPPRRRARPVVARRLRVARARAPPLACHCDHCLLPILLPLTPVPRSRRLLRRRGRSSRARLRRRRFAPAGRSHMAVVAASTCSTAPRCCCCCGTLFLVLFTCVCARPARVRVRVARVSHRPMFALIRLRAARRCTGGCRAVVSVAGCSRAVLCCGRALWCDPCQFAILPHSIGSLSPVRFTVGHRRAAFARVRSCAVRCCFRVRRAVVSAAGSARVALRCGCAVCCGPCPLPIWLSLASLRCDVPPSVRRRRHPRVRVRRRPLPSWQSPFDRH